MKRSRLRSTRSTPICSTNRSPGCSGSRRPGTLSDTRFSPRRLSFSQRTRSLPAEGTESSRVPSRSNTSRTPLPICSTGYSEGERSTSGSFSGRSNHRQRQRRAVSSITSLYFLRYVNVLVAGGLTPQIVFQSLLGLAILVLWLSDGSRSSLTAVGFCTLEDNSKRRSKGGRTDSSGSNRVSIWFRSRGAVSATTVILAIPICRSTGRAMRRLRYQT